jgi:hypothetical protein
MKKPEEETLRSLRRVTRNVVSFHHWWIRALFIGTFIELWRPWYAEIQIWLIGITALFQIVGQGHCLLTLLENLLLEKCNPEKIYWDPITYKGSFIRHYYSTEKI